MHRCRMGRSPLANLFRHRTGSAVFLWRSCRKLSCSRRCGTGTRSESHLIASSLCFASLRFPLLRFTSCCFALLRVASCCSALLHFASWDRSGIVLGFRFVLLCFASLCFALVCFVLLCFVSCCSVLRGLRFVLLRFASFCLALL